MKAKDVLKRSDKIVLAGSLLLFTIGYISIPKIGTYAFVLYLPIMLISFMVLISTAMIVVFRAAFYAIRHRQVPARFETIVFLMCALIIILFIIQPRSIFRKRASKKALTVEQNYALANLATLPYVGWKPSSETLDKSSVTYYDKSKAFDGINLYGTLGSSEIFLMDMNGTVVHKWPQEVLNAKLQNPIALARNSDVLYLDGKKKLLRVDFDGKVVWENDDVKYHHEITLGADGNIYALAQAQKMRRIKSLPVPFRVDYVVVLSPDGKIKKKISLFEAYKELIHPQTVLKVYKEILKPKIYYGMVFKKEYYNRFDRLHDNTITIIHKDIKNVCKKGDLLLSPRYLDIIAILDIETEKIKWFWGKGQLSRQHHPTQIENGNFLIFDNGVVQKRSRIVELDPAKKQIVWQYQGSENKSFYSEKRGGCQKLSNGNVLITESEKGRAFEITPSGQLVWEFYNPDIKTEENQRATIYRMIRITEPEKYPKLIELINKQKHLDTRRTQVYN